MEVISIIEISDYGKTEVQNIDRTDVLCAVVSERGVLWYRNPLAHRRHDTGACDGWFRHIVQPAGRVSFFRND